jgi:NTE family protein
MPARRRDGQAHRAGGALDVFLPGVPALSDARTRQVSLARMNEIAFNSSLLHEMRAIEFVQRLLDEGALTERFAARYKNMRIHVIGDQEMMKALGVASKSNPERAFLERLKAAGRACAEQWLEATIDDIGMRSSVNVRNTFL